MTRAWAEPGAPCALVGSPRTTSSARSAVHTAEPFAAVSESDALTGRYLRRAARSAHTRGLPCCVMEARVCLDPASPIGSVAFGGTPSRSAHSVSTWWADAACWASEAVCACDVYRCSAARALSALGMSRNAASAALARSRHVETQPRTFVLARTRQRASSAMDGPNARSSAVSFESLCGASARSQRDHT